MSHGIVHVDLPKAREALSDFLVRENPDAERRLAFDIRIEGDLRAGKQANRDIRLADCGKSARDGIVEFSHDQLVLDRGWPGCNMEQTVVTYRRSSFRAGRLVRPSSATPPD